jgi:hypothetical protein
MRVNSPWSYVIQLNKRKSILFLSLGLLLGSSIYFWNTYQNNPNKEIVPFEKILPGKSWTSVIPQLGELKGVGNVKASDCGKCHTEIYNEWKTSTHSQAYNDLQFQSELSKDPQIAWLCLNCHIPIQNQRETIQLGLIGGDIRKMQTSINPSVDPEMKEEGVTCASCHLRLDSNGNSIVIGSNGNLHAPHPVIADPEALKTRCYDCHNAQHSMNKTLVCYFKTGDEIKESGSHLTENRYCSNCHLPKVERSIVKQSLHRPKRNSHKHTFWGGGVPKNYELYKSIPNSGYKSSFALKEVKLFISPNANFSLSTTSSNLSKEQANATSNGSNERSSLTQEWKLELEIQNTNLSHYLPTGDPERHLIIRAEIINQDNKAIASTSWKIGQNWQWWPEAKLISDERLRAGETRKIGNTLTIPKEYSVSKEKNATSNGSIQSNTINGVLKITVHHVRLSEENAKHIKNAYQRVPLEFQEGIKNLEKNYPYYTLVFHYEKDLVTGQITQSSALQEIESILKIGKNIKYNKE